jgi:hypothetical protein
VSLSHVIVYGINNNPLLRRCNIEPFVVKSEHIIKVAVDFMSAYCWITAADGRYTDVIAPCLVEALDSRDPSMPDEPLFVVRQPDSYDYVISRTRLEVSIAHIE